MLTKIIPYIFAFSSIFLLGNKINENVKENSLDYKVIGQPLSSQDMELLNKDSLFQRYENLDHMDLPLFYEVDFDRDSIYEGLIGFYKKEISPNVNARFLAYYTLENHNASFIFVDSLENKDGFPIKDPDLPYYLLNTSIDKNNQTIDTKMCEEEYKQWVKWLGWILIKERD